MTTTFDPVRWEPPAHVPLTGPYAPNGLLDEPTLLPVPGGGPEDVLLDADGWITTGLHDGRIVRLTPDGTRATTVTTVQGRPLGLEWLHDGRILACVAGEGLLAVPQDGSPYEVLAREVDGRPMRLVNNATVLADGTIYFTDSSQRHDLGEYPTDALERKATGRLLRRDPDGSLDVVFGGMGFANGVTATPDGASVLVAATMDYSIRRVPLHGPHAGRPESFVDVLPGMPDNLSTSEDGTIWVGMPALRSLAVDALHRSHPAIRKAVNLIPQRFERRFRDAMVERFGMVLGFDTTGRCTHNLQGDGSRYAFITSAREHDGHLYMGCVDEDVTSIAKVPVPPAR